MENSLEYVEKITPFPMAQDLLLLAKPSIPEQVLVSALDDDGDAQKQTPGKKLEPLEPLDSEQPFAPFLEDATHGELPGNGKQETAANGGLIDGESNSVISRGKEEEVEEEGTDDNGVEEVGNDALESKTQLSDQKEDVIIQRRNWGDGLETDALKDLEDSEPFSRKDVILGNGVSDGEKTGVLKEGGESDTVQEKEDAILENGGEGRQETDALKEEKVSADVADVQGFGENRKGEEEIDRVLEQQNVGSSVNLVGEIETLTETEGVTEIEPQGSEANNKVDRTGKLETLEVAFANEHQEQESMAGIKGVGGEMSGQASVDQNAHKLSEVAGSPSEKKKQLNGDIDASFHSISRPFIPIPDGQEPANQRSSTSGSNIVGEILYNHTVGDEDGRSRQRILAFAAKRYAANVSKNPQDHDALYNWALVLQESADNAGSEMDSMSKDALLAEACKKYEAATQLCPTLQEAYYNWAIAISDRAKVRGRTKEAEELWKQACDRYDRSVQLNWNSPQALNNWGLALQELSAIVPLKEKRAIVKKAVRKFRAAIQLQFDFHRAVYNLGTVLYGLAEDSSRSGRKMNPKELTPADLYSLSAVYIAAAHALKPDYPVYRGALRLVRSMLPLPYIKAGWLKIPPPGKPLAPHCDWMLLWFVLDHEALYEMEKVDRKTLAHSYSRRGVFAESSTSSLPARPSLLRIAVEDIVHMAPSADLSLPPGGGFCIDTVSGPQNLIAETWDAVDAWVDAVRLVYTIYAQGKKDVLAGLLAG
ncbi:unnamed protein product [Sphagnum balticum]